MKKSVLIGAFVVSLLLLVASAFFGARGDLANAGGENNSTSQGKLRAIVCPDSYRGAEICTKEYNPVCGWYNASKVQCIKYPCAIEAGNICEACSNSDVEYYTEGLCPSEDVRA
jgi:hypothetical protein